MLPKMSKWPCTVSVSCKTSTKTSAWVMWVTTTSPPYPIACLFSPRFCSTTRINWWLALIQLSTQKKSSHLKGSRNTWHKNTVSSFTSLLYGFIGQLLFTTSINPIHKPSITVGCRVREKGCGIKPTPISTSSCPSSNSTKRTRTSFYTRSKTSTRDTTKSTGRGPSHNQKPSSKTAHRFIWIPSTANGRSISTRSCSSYSSPSLTMSTASTASARLSICNMSYSLHRSLRPIAKAMAKPDWKKSDTNTSPTRQWCYGNSVMHFSTTPTC